MISTFVDDLGLGIMDYYDADFERRKMEPMYWFNKASDMRNSAGAMWYAISHPQEVREWLKTNCELSSGGADYSVFHMLCGLSLELIYKAVIVSGQKYPKTVHKLNVLRKDAGISASDNQFAALEIYGHIIYWQAKYPVATKVEFHREYIELVDKHLYDEVPGLSIKLKQWNNLIDWNMFNSLWLDGVEEFQNKNPHLFS